MLNILLKTLVCHYLHWIFFPCHFCLALINLQSFLHSFLLYVCVRACVCFSISAHFCLALICLALCWTSALLCGTILTICFCQCIFILNTSFLTLIDNIAILLYLLFYNSFDLLFFDVLVWSAISSIKRTIFTNSVYSYYEILQDKQ